MKFDPYGMQAPAYNCMIEGNARVLEEDDKGIFLFDRKAKIYILDQPDPKTALEWVQNHLKEHMMICCAYEHTYTYLQEKLGFAMKASCMQVVWTQDEPDAHGPLDLKLAQLADLSEISRLYDLADEKELEQAVRNGELLTGWKDGCLAGFAGLHPEGGMGLLVVKEEFRNRGYASQLEKAAILLAMEKGLVPYAHIFTDNIALIGLQKKLGLKFSEDLFAWLER